MVSKITSALRSKMKIIFASFLWWCWSYWEAQRKVNIKVQKDLARKKKKRLTTTQITTKIEPYQTNKQTNKKQEDLRLSESITNS